MASCATLAWGSAGQQLAVALTMVVLAPADTTCARLTKSAAPWAACLRNAGLQVEQHQPRTKHALAAAL